MAGLLSGLAHLGLGALEKEDVFATEEKKKAEEKAVHVPREEEFLLDRNFVCPVCGKTFNAKAVRSSKLRLVGADADLRPIYEQLDINKYDAVACNACGYAALTKSFPTVSEKQVEALREKIAANYSPQRESDEPFYSYDDAIGRYKLALASSVVKQGKISERAYICLKAAWVLRGKRENLPDETEDYDTIVKETEMQELEFLQAAMDGFLTVRGSEAFPVYGMDSLTLDYLIAALAARLGKKDVAKKFLSGVLASRTANKRLKDKALDLKDSLKS